MVVSCIFVGWLCAFTYFWCMLFWEPWENPKSGQLNGFSLVLLYFIMINMWFLTFVGYRSQDRSSSFNISCNLNHHNSCCCLKTFILFEILITLTDLQKLGMIMKPGIITNVWTKSDQAWSPCNLIHLGMHPINLIADILDAIIEYIVPEPINLMFYVSPGTSLCIT